MAAGPRPFAVGGAAKVRGETVGEGPPIVLCHGLTATRRSVVHGSRVLERDGHTVVAYDARGHGESDPPGEGRSYVYPALVNDLAAVVEATAGEEPVLLAGHSMGAHTALAYALRDPSRVRGVVAIGPTYTGELVATSLAYWDGLAEALAGGGVDGFVDYIERNQEADSAWRDSIRRFTRERMLRHRHPEALVEALREVPRSQPFEWPAALEALDLPVLVVASHDAADPGHPRHVAESYAERLPQSELIGEEQGQSPLAWQGGRLSRAIAAFAAEIADP